MLSIIDNVLIFKEVKIIFLMYLLLLIGDRIILFDCLLKFRSFLGFVFKSYG